MSPTPARPSPTVLTEPILFSYKLEQNEYSILYNIKVNCDEKKMDEMSSFPLTSCYLKRENSAY